MTQTLAWPVDLQRQDEGAMRAQGVGNTALAARLGLTEGAVRRLIDLDHRSHIGQIETALHALGRRLTVATQAA